MAAEDFRNHLRRLSGTINVMISELVRGEPLCVKRAKAGFIAEEWAAGHGHAAGEQHVDR